MLRGSIESKAYLWYAADSVGAQLTPLTQLVVPTNLRYALTVFYLLFFNTIRPTAQQQVFCCQSEFSRKLSLAADSVGLVDSPATQWLGGQACALRWADDLCQDVYTFRVSGQGDRLRNLNYLLQSKKQAASPVGDTPLIPGLSVHYQQGGFYTTHISIKTVSPGVIIKLLFLATLPQ